MFGPGEPWDVGPVAVPLLALVNGPWTVPDLRLAAVMNGWKVSEHRSYPCLRFEMGGPLGLTSPRPSASPAIELRQATYGHLLLYYHCEENDLRDEEFGDFGKVDFDHAFEVYRDRLSKDLGRPTVEGLHDFRWWPNSRYHHGIWRGEPGLLILQQGETDLHRCSGFDLSVILDRPGPGPSSPRAPVLVLGRGGSLVRWDEARAEP